MQYRVYWWSGKTRSQGISSNDASWRFIKLTSCEHHGISNHCQLDFCETYFSGLPQWKHQSSAILKFCAGNPPQMARNAVSISMSWRHHVLTWQFLALAEDIIKCPHILVDSVNQFAILTQYWHASTRDTLHMEGFISLNWQLWQSSGSS